MYMSGNASRKYKQYMLIQERIRLFGNISARDENGRLDLVALSAAQGRIITSRTQYDPSKVSANTKKRN